MSGIQMKDDGKGKAEIIQQKARGDVALVLLRLGNGELVKVTVVGNEASASVVDENGRAKL